MKIKRRKTTIGIPAVAMADIAFNLVLFFIMLAKTEDDRHLKWDAASSTELEQVQKAKVSIVIDENSKIYLNTTQVAEKQLKDMIEAELGTLPQGKRTVLLKTHKEVNANRFQPVVEAISQAGGEMVHILKTRRN
jgi:biopolymer transport protein ExbD